MRFSYYLLLCVFVSAGCTKAETETDATASVVQDYPKTVAVWDLELPEGAYDWYSQFSGEAAVPDTTWHVAWAYTVPDSGTEPAGSIVFRARFDSIENGWALDASYEFQSEDGAPRLVWVDDIDDMEYGVTTATNTVVDTWRQLPGYLHNPSLWVETGYTQPLDGRLIQFEDAAFAFDQYELPGAGPYFVVASDSQHVELREEIPSDMACGMPPELVVDPPQSEQRVYRVQVSVFFSQDGRAHFRLAYPRGC